jgi:hypothetical protein
MFAILTSMKKSLLILFAFFLTGCMQYATPHGQDITIKNIERLPVKVGLYIPETISKDSVLVYDGEEIFHSHLYLLLRTGAAMAHAIKKAVSASVSEVVIYDTLPDQNESIRNSLTFLVIPEFTRIEATLWMLFGDTPAAYESELKLTFMGKNREIIDCIHIHTIGVSNLKTDSSHLKDTVIADAADSAIASMQDQIVYYLTRNNKLRSYLGIPNPSNDIVIATPATHGIYGTTSQFELDTISYTLRPIPSVRRWSAWMGEFLNLDYGSDNIDLSLGVDLLVRSHISFGLELIIFNFISQWESPINFGILGRTSYLFFGPKHFLEAGLGIRAVVGKLSNPYLQRFEPSAIIGYRYQPILSGICLGISYTPYIDQRGFEDRITLNAGFAF